MTHLFLQHKNINQLLKTTTQELSNVSPHYVLQLTIRKFKKRLSEQNSWVYPHWWTDDMENTCQFHKQTKFQNYQPSIGHTN